MTLTTWCGTRVEGRRWPRWLLGWLRSMPRNFGNAWRSFDFSGVTWWQWLPVLSFAVFLALNCAFGLHVTERFRRGCFCVTCGCPWYANDGPEVHSPS